jgi:DNA-binding CsgD family transcriptional regulator
VSTFHLHLCELALRAGDWAAAERHLAEWDRPYGAEHVNEPMQDRCAALLAAGRGDRAEAERLAAHALQGVAQTGLRWDELEARRAQGLAALLAREPAAAAERLLGVWEHVVDAKVGEPGTFPFAPDLIEALAATGRAALAHDVLAWLHEADSPWAHAALLRGEGVLERDEARLEQAHAAYGRLGMPFDAARTLLAHADLARRARRWAQARDRLEAAAQAFAALGSQGWAARARDELALVAPRRRRRRPEELTAAERRVADLAAGGRTNREIAAALAISVNTVEAHLSRAYLKLGVRSRREL